ncbi:MAG: AI-2E family transporter [Porticoccaceae bacterium]|nr:AI-2E family transporter [Porticoccaceae bacterium]
MKQVLSRWLGRYFGNEETVLLAVMLVASLVLMATIGGFLGPVFTALILSFLLQGVVNTLQRAGASPRASMVTSYVLFLLGLVAILVGLVPIVGRQMSLLLAEVPSMISRIQGFLVTLPERYSDYLTVDQFDLLSMRISEEIANMAEQILTFSISSFPSLLAVAIYLLLVPVLVFFMLKDRQELFIFVANLLPRKRPVMTIIWSEMNVQFANYVRGKAIEILIVGSLSFGAFLLLGLNYAALLALLVGLSVLIPYIGASVVTLPVLLVGYSQWGYSAEFLWLFFTYGVIQFFDGNVLVPLLFSEVVNLHPIAIIVAVLLFGGIWGFWGVFFAIPLATLVKAVFNAWPDGSSLEEISEG